MDPRDDRTSIIRAEFKTFLANQLRSNVRPLSPTQQSSGSNVSNNNNISNALNPGWSQDTGPPQLPSGPQLPPLTFGAMGSTTISTPISVHPREGSLTPVTERSSFITHERSLSAVGLSTTNNSATEQNSQQQRPRPSLDVQVQQAIPSERNAALSLVPEQSVTSGSLKPTTPIPEPTPSMLMVNTKLETRPELTLPTLNNSSTATLLTNPHHSPTATVLTNPHHSPTATLLTNPHYSPTQSVFTNPHHSPVPSVLPNPNPSSSSPTTTNSSTPPLPNVGDASSSASANPSSPIPQSVTSASVATVVPNPVKSEGGTATGFPRSPLGLPLDRASASSLRAPSTTNSTQPFPNVLLDQARIKTQEIIANQHTKDPMFYESANDQRQATSSKDRNTSSPLPRVSSQQPQPLSQHDDANKFINEAEALYYTQQSETPSASSSGNGALRQQPQNLGQQENFNEDKAETSQPQAKNTHVGGSIPVAKSAGDVAIDSKHLSVQRNGKMPAVVNTPRKTPIIESASVVGRQNPTRSGLGRKPSGARAQFTPHSYNGPEEKLSQPLTEEEENSMSDQHKRQDTPTGLSYDDANAEVLAALTYMDIADSEVSAPATPPSPPQYHSPIVTAPSTEPLKFQLSDRHSGSMPPSMSSSDSVPYKSSFAPSSKVAERKLIAQAKQAAHEAAKHRPGRANGKGKKKAKATEAWESSEEDEEDEDEDEDEDVDSDPEVPMLRGPQSTSSHHGLSSSSSARLPQSNQYGTSDSNTDGPPSHLRPPRHLPQVPPPGRAGKWLRLMRLHRVYVY